MSTKRGRRNELRSEVLAADGAKLSPGDAVELSPAQTAALRLVCSSKSM